MDFSHILDAKPADQVDRIAAVESDLHRRNHALIEYIDATREQLLLMKEMIEHNTRCIEVLEKYLRDG